MTSIKSVFSKLQSSVAKASVLSLFLIMSFFIPNSFNAYADGSCNSSIGDSQDSSYRGPVYLDSYWTDRSSSSSTSSGNPVKTEIGPGEGPSTLAVVLVNRNPSDIINVVGVLNLPAGFVPTGTSGDAAAKNIFKASLRMGQSNPAVASYDNTVTAGSTFTLYFDINVTNKTRTGLFPTPLVMSYYRTGDFQLCNSALLTVPFMLPGKVVLDAVPITTSIEPNKPSTVSISIQNKGSADATGVIITILSLGQSKTTGSSGSSSSSVVLQSSQTQLVNLGANTFNIGTIPAFKKTTISTTVYPSSVTGGSTQNVQIQIDYGNAYGYKQSAVIATGLVVLPDNTTPTLNISSSNDDSSPLVTAGKLENLNFTVTNHGSTTLSNIVISLTPPSSDLSIVGNSKWTIPSMEPGDVEQLSTQVFAATSLINTPASFSVTATYISNGVAKSDSLNLGTFVVGDITILVNNISLSNVGGSQTLTGSLLNQGSTTGLFTSVQLLHPELLEIPAQNGTHFRNGQAAYLAQGADQSQFSGSSEQFSGGSGQRARGSFSSQTITADSEPQYVGDLTADSPTPFSIPLSGIITPGAHKVSFKVSYADDLKHVHELILNGTLNAQQNAPSGNTARNSGLGSELGLPRGGTMMFLYLPITGASAVIGTVFVMRRRNSLKNKIQKNKKDIDIESLLDDSSSNNK